MMHGTDLKLLIVDHLHVLAPSSPRQNEYQKLSEATAALKALAMELGVPVLLLAQMNRAGTRQDRDRNGGIEAAPPRPQLADLRGSGTIEQDADAVVFLWAHQGIRASSAPVQVLVEKNRHGPLAEIDTQWLRSQGQRFVVGAAVEPSQEVREELARRRDRAGSGPRDSEDLFQ
jgi:replicative DNA helicase